MSDTDIEAVKQWASSIQEHFGKLQVFADELKREFDELKRESDALKKCFVELKEELELFKTDRQTLDARYSALEARSTELEKQLEFLKKEPDIARLHIMSFDNLHILIHLAQAEILARQWGASLENTEAKKASEKMARKMGACTAEGGHLIAYAPGCSPDELFIAIAN